MNMNWGIAESCRRIKIGAYAAVLALLISAQVFADAVTFVAIGRPSMLKITGKCEGQLISRQPFEAVVKLETCTTGIALRDRHMKEKYLEIEIHPDATLRGQMPGPGEFKGTLTVHGKEAPVVGEMRDGILRFSTTITAHGMKLPTFLGVTVADTVEITAEIRGVK